MTHEFRVSTDQSRRWRLLGGVFYDTQKTQTVSAFELASTPEVDTNGNVLPGTGAFQPLAQVGAYAQGANAAGKMFNPRISFVNDFTRQTDQVAVYGQAQYDVTPEVTVSASARWYNLEFAYEGTTNTSFGCKFPAPGFFPDATNFLPQGCDGSAFDNNVSARLDALGKATPAALQAYFGTAEANAILADIQAGRLDVSDLNSNGKVEVSDVIPRFSVEWHPTGDVMLYSAYSEGFRPPMANRNAARPANNPNNLPVFANYRVPPVAVTDTLKNYEIGAKTEFFDHTLRLNATAYYSKISDLQTSRFDPSNVAFLVFVENVGDAEIRGLDVDMSWLATAHLSLGAAFTALDTRITKLNPQLQGVAVPKGSDLPYAPHFSGTLHGRYDFELPAFGGRAYVNGSIAYTGESKSGITGNAYFVEDTARLVYGRGTGLKIDPEGGRFHRRRRRHLSEWTLCAGRLRSDEPVGGGREERLAGGAVRRQPGRRACRAQHQHPAVHPQGGDQPAAYRGPAGVLRHERLRRPMTVPRWAGSVADELRLSRQAIENARFADAATRLVALLAELPEESRPGGRSHEAGRFNEAGLSGEGRRFDDADSFRSARVEALYLLAVAERYRGRPEQALAALERLLATSPEHARGHQERAHSLCALGREADALAGYRRAVALNPALLASWKALMALAARHGTAQESQLAERHVAFLGSLPAELVGVMDLLHEGDLERAERVCRAFLKQHPRHVEGMRLLAELAQRLGVFDDAEFLLESCVALAPRHVGARIDYMNVLIRKTRFAQANEQAKKLLTVRPNDPALETSLATTLVGVGRVEEGIAGYRRVLERQPDNAEVHVLLGHALKTVGDLQGAVDRLPAGVRNPARLRRCVLEPGEYQDLSVQRRRACPHGGTGPRTGDRQRRSHPSLFRRGQGPGGPR